MLDQYYNQIERALDKACPKQKEIIINRNNPWHKGTLKQLRIEKFARFEEYKKDRSNLENKTKYYKTLNKYRSLCRQKQKKHERDQTEAMGDEAEMSKYLNKIIKNKASPAPSRSNHQLGGAPYQKAYTSQLLTLYKHRMANQI